jgi:putative SOS response-associated peptidase YedK
MGSMCGRYTLTRLADLNLAFPWITPPDESLERYNIAPSQAILAAINTETPKFDHLLWGLVPFWAKDRSVGNKMINARCETLAEKPAFKNALRKRRCIIPADGFFEWRKEGQGKKTPMYIRLKSRKPFAFAGLWDTWRDPAGGELRSCTIITCPPNELVRSIHDRMPAMLDTEQAKQWLCADERPAEELTDLLKPFAADQMEAIAVSTAVNNPRDDSSRCIEPQEPQDPEPSLFRT